MIQSLQKPVRERDESYLAWIRQQPCLVAVSLGVPICSGRPDDSIDAHHIYEKGKAGVGTKPPDRRAVPLCRRAHEYYHATSKTTFEARWCLNLEREITRLNREYDALHRPTPKPRKRAFKADVRVRNCVLCGHTHLISLAKVTIGQREVRYWCANRSQNAVADR